jgi:hypothetical protein
VEIKYSFDQIEIFLRKKKVNSKIIILKKLNYYLKLKKNIQDIKKITSKRKFLNKKIIC